MPPANAAADILSGILLTSILPGLLSVLGAIVGLVFASWGVLKVYALLSGQSSTDVAYKIGRIFGDEVYEGQYDKYKSQRALRERRDSFSARYDRERE